MAINNACDLILAGEAGDNLFISSRSRNQFFESREMCLDFLVSFCVMFNRATCSNHV